MKKLLIFIILLLTSICNFCQELSSNWITLYEKNNLKIEIKFRIENNGCESNGHPSTYEYRYNGFLLDSKKYLNWKIDYINCNGMYYTYSNGVQIGGSNIKKQIGYNKIEDFQTDNFDDQITSKKIISYKPYDIKIGNFLKKSNLESIILPDKINGDNSVCLGNSTKLYIDDKNIGNSITKLEWFRNSCQNKNMIGTGKFKNIRPINDTKYYLRAITKSGAKSKCIEKKVKVYNKNVAANSIISSKNEICDGELVKLIADGKSDENWVWKNQSNNIIIGKGSSISFKPKENITVELYSNNNVCKRSESVLKEISVNPKSSIGRISTNYNKRNKLYLKVENLSLAPNSRNNWYYEKNNKKKLLTTDLEIIYPKKELTTYFANTTGGKCDNPEKFLEIKVEELPKYDWNYGKVDFNKNNHHHLGFNIGYIAFKFNDSINSTNNIFANEKHEILNNGLLIGLTYQPFFLKRFSFGIHADYSNDFNFLNKIKYKKNDYFYEYDNSYSKINASIELALGVKPLKLLFGYKFMNFNNSLNTYKATGSRSNYDIFQTFKSEEKIINQSIKIGLRIGQYDHGKKKDKSGSIFDISITANNLVRNKNLSFDDLIYNHNNIENWNPGINISWWKHRFFKLGIDAIYYDNYKTLSINTLDLNELFLTFNFIYSFDRFK